MHKMILLGAFALAASAVAAGGSWTLYDTADGKNANTVLSGTYTIPAGGQPALVGPRSVTSPK